MTKEKGFTLIELLVVVSIIGLLSSIVLASLVGAKNKAKVTTLVQNIHQFQNAMEMYKGDTGYYPYENSSSQWFSINSTMDQITPAFNALNFFPKYTSKIPDRIYTKDQIAYLNPAMANSMYYTCDGPAPINGYLIYYWDRSGTIVSNSLPTLYYNGAPMTNNTYCFTMN